MSNPNLSVPTIITRSEHNLSRANISPNALKVLYRLKNAGYQACLVGGGVRDLLLGREPKDFDVGTSARPEEVRQLFRNCRLIGRRFRLAHILFGREIVEVATFRARHDGEVDHESGDRSFQNGRLVRDNVYGAIEEDAWRRDFTMNALYYDIENFSVLDYVQGMKDLKGGTIRLIGDPENRFREDPVRLLRAVRFSAKLGFRIHKDTEIFIGQLGYLLQDIPGSRLYEEVLKLFLLGTALSTFELLRHYGLFQYLFPLTEASLSEQSGDFPLTLVTRAMANTDERVNMGKSVTPAFLFAALLWEPMRRRAEDLVANGLSMAQAVHTAGGEVVRRQSKNISVPKRFSLPMREIWGLQARLERNSGKRALNLLNHPRFRAAYDFLLLRGETGEVPTELGEWWTKFQQASASEQKSMVATDGPRKRRRGRARRPSIQTP
ncbi:MAG: polynucleotide adenylyltransferase PcnB [Gammaproteobacteria bacterium]